MTTDMQGKVVLITGGNTGIGKATAVALARMGARVTITSRDPDKGQAALADIRRQAGSDTVQCMRLDLASLAGVRHFAADFTAGHPRLDVLINNAGLVLKDRSETVDGFETTFGVNHLGHFVLTHELLPLLRRSAPARVVVLASEAHRGARGGLDFDDLQLRRKYGGWKAYSRSKLANLLFTLELAERLRGSGVTVNAVHPGVVASEFAASEDIGVLFGFLWKISRWALLSPEQGARTSVYVASAPELAEVSGGYFARCKPARPTRAAQDRGAALRLWEISEQLTATTASTASA
ncbi:SDR family oxidoreductase [Nannocystis sp.]|uniref:SDR family oxidoreductase n=1 Tax=Nannocystis sp. TaxID=1962667 RepID=UPI0025F863FA|nr:SDR family oxidoreductase [Nannocystis sp.]MBK7824429.1 SDR family oxidoreductase [Nannocystis sp.]